jgi:capsular polysaccharide transport system permease protein
MRAALLTFRTSSSTIDPISSAASIGGTIAQLTREKIALEANRNSLLNMLNADSPTVRFMGTQIDALDSQIKSLQARLTGHVQGLQTTASQLADFEDLKLQSMFAEKLLELSQSSLERARAEIEKQQLFLVTIVRPPLPEEARYPRQFVGTLMIFVICLVLWSMVTLVTASIRDHIG